MDEKTALGVHVPSRSADRRTIRRRAAPKVIGRLDIIRRIGSGASGHVYEAVDPTTQQRYVVKALSKLTATDVRRFKREAELMARLHHPNLMPVLKVNADADPPHYVMPLRDGITASERIRLAPLSLPFVLQAGRDVASGLSQAHAFGIVHRDVKPANVFLEKADGRAVLLDFGLAKLPQASEQITAPGALLGTPAYMAPEQCLGEPIGDRTDVYSLGVVLAEVLLGLNPFRSESLLATITLHVEAAHRRLDALLPGRVPRELGELVSRMLAREPRHRPRMTSVKDQLEGMLRVSKNDGPTWSYVEADSGLAAAFCGKN